MISVLRELWAFRELAIVLTWRELVVRYKRSVLGVVWALGEPLMMVLVYVVVFGEFLKAGSGFVANYAVYAMLGVLAWTFLSSTLERSSSTFIDYAPFFRKVYFPRELFIFAVVVSRLSTLLAGLLVAFLAVVAVPAWRGSVAWERAPWLALGVLGLTAICIGLGLLLAALNTLFRDTSFIVRFGLRLAFYICPIVYPLERVPAAARSIIELNPLVAVLWTFQAFADPALAPPSVSSTVSAVVVCSTTLLIGWALFRRLQWRVADAL